MNEKKNEMDYKNWVRENPSFEKKKSSYDGILIRPLSFFSKLNRESGIRLGGTEDEKRFSLYRLADLKIKFDFTSQDALMLSARHDLTYLLMNFWRELKRRNDSRKIKDKIELLNGLNIHIKGNCQFYQTIVKVRVWKNIQKRLFEILEIDSSYEIPLYFSSYDQQLVKCAEKTNLLRLLTTSFAGFLGGAKNFILSSYNGSESDESFEYAENIFNLLNEESKVFEKESPVDGSFFFQEYISNLEKQVWEDLQILDSKGEWSEEEFEEHFFNISKDLLETRTKNLILKSEIVTTINDYPSLDDKFNFPNKFCKDKMNYYLPLIDEFRSQSSYFHQKNKRHPKVLRIRSEKQNEILLFPYEIFGVFCDDLSMNDISEDILKNKDFDYVLFFYPESNQENKIPFNIEETLKNEKIFYRTIIIKEISKDYIYECLAPIKEFFNLQ